MPILSELAGHAVENSRGKVPNVVTDSSAANQHATSIREEIERKRLERAQQLLLTTTDKIAHIARSCGFAGGEQFCRAFARRIGDTPSDFRRKQSREAVQTPS